MVFNRPEDQRIDRYTGPYERWVYSPELAMHFAFPPESELNAGYFTALLEGGDTVPFPAGVDARLPPLWAPGDIGHTVLPFAFHRLIPHGRGIKVDTDLTETLDNVGAARYRVNFPIRPDAWVEDYARGDAMTGWTTPATTPKAIVAIIDDGIAFGHRAFLDAGGMKTRISHCWLQSAPAQTRDAVPFGRELRNGDIDALRTQAGGDEARLYRLSGTLRDGRAGRGGLLRRHVTHGAHVLGLAAGNGTGLSQTPMDDDVQIIAVQLPNAISWDTSGFGKEMYLLSALHYVFDRARKIAAASGAGVEELPLFVNLSYGWTAGRHDGKSALQEAMQYMLTERRAIQPHTQIVMPMGNEFAASLYAEIDEDRMADGSCRIGWQVQPDDRTCSYVEIWFPEGMDPSDYQIDIVPPHGQTSGRGALPMTADPSLIGGDPRRFVELEAGGVNIGQMSADKDRGTRWRAMIALLPTVPLRDESRCAPSGRWTIEVSRIGKAAQVPTGTPIQVRVQRDDDPVRIGTGGRQSYLVDLSPQPAPDPLAVYDGQFDFVRGYGCSNAIAVADDILRVGGYEWLTGYPSRYSGSGPVSMDGPRAPIISASAPSDRSRARPGVMSLGVLSGSRGALVGTSAACPQVTRQLALNCVAGRDMWDGFAVRPDHLGNTRAEPQTPRAKVQHEARLGAHILPPPNQRHL